MDKTLEELLAAIPDRGMITVRELINALSKLPGSKAAHIEIEQHSQHWVLTIDLTDLT
jgi:hypothetical protein